MYILCKSKQFFNTHNYYALNVLFVVVFSVFVLLLFFVVVVVVVYFFEVFFGVDVAVVFCFLKSLLGRGVYKYVQSKLQITCSINILIWFTTDWFTIIFFIDIINNFNCHMTKSL